ncbi:MAG: hypothetical protein KIS66_07970 [Fimbriimonadaceae bacterium]|nr:hypothetical protein [Fimbriimonadaceae bacterium]
MSQSLPWIALVLAACAVFLRPRTERAGEPPSSVGPISVGTALALALFGWFAAGSLAPDVPALRSAAAAFFVGVALVRLERALAERLVMSGSAAWALGLGAFLIGVAPFALGTEGHAPLLALVAGLALGSVGAGAVSRLPLAAFGVVGMNLLGGLSGEENLRTAGQVIAIAVGLAAVLTSLAAGLLKERGQAARPWIASVLATAAAVLVAETYLGVTNGLVVSATAGAAALVTHLSLRARGETFGFLVACLVWLGVATVSFGYMKGFGMAVAWTVALGTLMTLGDRRALLATGPLASLVAYRLFREFQKDAARAFDIGQHYAIVGLILAAGVGLLILEFGRSTDATKTPMRSVFGLDLGLLGAIALQICSFVLLSAKGAVGFLVGAGLTPVVAGLRGDRDEHGLVLGLGFACLSPVLYSLLVDKLELSRDDKRSFLFVGVAIVAVLGVLALLVTPHTSESTSS